MIKRAKRTCDKTVVVLMALLLIMGLITLFSATYYQKSATGDALAAVKKQLIGVALGAAACVVLSRVPYRFFRRPKVTLLLLAISTLLLILVIIPGIGVSINGSRRWLNIGGLSMQPSEFAKYAMVIFMAGALDRRSEALGSLFAGVAPLLNMVHNKGKGTVIIMDNRTTAMTGQQGNPFNGVTLQHRESHELNLPAILSALGVDHVQTVDPFDMNAVRTVLKEATTREELDVIIFQGPCVLLDKSPKPTCFVNETCTACGVCKTLGCPAISSDSESGTCSIDQDLCIGCNQCVQYCRYGAIELK